MAPSSGTKLVLTGMRVLKEALARSHSYLQTKITPPTAQELVLVVPARASKCAPRSAGLRARWAVQQSRLFSTFSHLQSQASRELARTYSGLAHEVSGTAASSATATSSATVASATRSALGRTLHAPFSSPLRPNLTGGALPRCAGGYGLGGGSRHAARHFSHTASAQAQVVQNVSAAVRGFLVQGWVPVYDGVDGKGQARFRAVGANQREVENKTKTGNNNKGTSLEFRIAPVITALSAWKSVAGYAEKQQASLLSGFDAQGDVLDETALCLLTSDFSRQVLDLAAVHADLKRLSKLGTLPISADGATLRVRFAGCDGRTVAALCDEVGVTRGVVREDEGWRVDDDWLGGAGPRTQHDNDASRDVEMALLFPMAPSDGADYFETLRPGRMEWRSMMSQGSETESVRGSETASVRGSETNSTGGDPFNAPLHPRHSAPRSAGHSASPAGQTSLPSWSDLGPDQLSSPGQRHSPYEELAMSEAEDSYHQPQHQHHQHTQHPLSHAPTGYEGVEGIYRFLAELEAAGRR